VLLNAALVPQLQFAGLGAHAEPRSGAPTQGPHVYFAPKSERAGGFWLPSLAHEIAEATVFVLLVGEKGVGQWQVLEYNEALARRVKEPAFPLVPVVLDGQPAPGLPFLRQLHWVRMGALLRQLGRNPSPVRSFALAPHLSLFHRHFLPRVWVRSYMSYFSRRRGEKSC
jgi:hypothetical protein